MTTFTFFIKTQIFLYTDNSALCNLVKNKFIYHIFLGFPFGNSPRWHGPPDMRSTGRDNLLKHSGRMPNSTRNFPNWSALGMMGTDSWTPGSVQGKPLGGCSSLPGPAFVSSASEIFAELWCHCPERPWMGLPMRKVADTGLDIEFENFAWQIWKLLLLPWVNLSVGFLALRREFRLLSMAPQFCVIRSCPISRFISHQSCHADDPPATLSSSQFLELIDFFSFPTQDLCTCCFLFL